MKKLLEIFGRRRKQDTVASLKERVDRFRDLVEKNNQVLELIADAGEKAGGEYIFDIQYLKTLVRELDAAAREIVFDLNAITGNRYLSLINNLEIIEGRMHAILDERIEAPKAPLVIGLDRIGMDQAESVGEKMAHLGEIKNLLGTPVPEGFAVSAHACKLFFEDSGVWGDIGVLQDHAETLSPAEFEKKAAEIQEKIRRAALPRKHRKAITRAAGQLKKKTGCLRFAIRSSALGEDGDKSFAGQYETLLGVANDHITQAYKEVLASLYSGNVIAYRRKNGMNPAQGLMAVGCLCMVPARAAGVIYTLDPTSPRKDALVIVAARGLGKTVVDGSAGADRFLVSRQPPHRVLSREVNSKGEMFTVTADQGLVSREIPENERNIPAVSDGMLQTLAEEALKIERYMKRAQDIEWAVSMENRVSILQARTLRLSPLDSRPSDMHRAVAGYPVALKDRGVVACRGIASGPVYIVAEGGGGSQAPPGSVLVARTSTPRLAQALARASAVLTDLGTPTGHLAAIAREFRVPAIMDMETATSKLKNGEIVTVDAEENVVYKGKVDELLHYQLLQNSSYEDTPEFRLLRKIMKKTAPLNLKDPQASNFTAENCRTYHDIIRFAHEKAVNELTEGTWVNPSRGSRFVYRLDLPFPIDLVLIDLGGGVEVEEASKTVTADQVASAPLKALLEGLSTEGVWATGPADMDLDGFMASATRSVALTGPIPARPEQNLAIVSAHYLNLSLKLGYHFNIVDCFLGEERNDNYIYFRFAGGATEFARRSRRARLLKKILDKQDFVLDGKGDLVIGRIKKMPYDVMLERLRMIGRLIGFTRQLDIFLRDDSLVDRCANGFLEGEYNPSRC